jgi:hypothetical protein
VPKEDSEGAARKMLKACGVEEVNGYHRNPINLSGCTGANDAVTRLSSCCLHRRDKVAVRCAGNFSRNDHRQKLNLK